MFPYLKGVNWTLLPMPSVCLSVHLFVCILLQWYTSPAVRDSKLKYSQILCCLGMKQANIKKTSQVKVDLTWRGFRLSNEELCCPPYGFIIRSALLSPWYKQHNSSIGHYGSGNTSYIILLFKHTLQVENNSLQLNVNRLPLGNKDAQLASTNRTTQIKKALSMDRWHFKSRFYRMIT